MTGVQDVCSSDLFFGRNDAKAETPVLWPPHAKSWIIGKDSDAGRDWGQEEKGMTEEERVGWYQWLNGHEVGDGQGGLACCSPCGRRVRYDWETELNWTDKWKKHGSFWKKIASSSELKIHVSWWGCIPLIYYKLCFNSQQWRDEFVHIRKRAAGTCYIDNIEKYPVTWNNVLEWKQQAKNSELPQTGGPSERQVEASGSQHSSVLK